MQLEYRDYGKVFLAPSQKLYQTYVKIAYNSNTRQPKWESKKKKQEK